MKKLFLLLVFFINVANVHADQETRHVEIDGIQYQLTGFPCAWQIWVEKNDKHQYKGNITIPDVIITDVINDNSYSGKVSGIYGSAFDGCNELSSVTCLSGDVLKVYKDFSKNVVENVTLYVPDNLIEKYKSNYSAWNKFGTIDVIEKVTDFVLTYYVEGEVYATQKYKYNDVIVPIDEPTKTGYTFSGWKNLPKNMPGKDISVNGSFERGVLIEGIRYTFEDDKAVIIGNSGISGELSIPSSVELIGKKYEVSEIAENAFRNCTDITSIIIPNSIISIGERAFHGCEGITSLVIPENVKTLGIGAFSACIQLSSLVIKGRIEDIPESAFSNCSSLTYI